MKKLIVITFLLLLLAGCQEKVDLTIPSALDDVHEVQKETQDPNSISVGMANAIYDITNTTNEAMGYLNSQGLENIRGANKDSNMRYVFDAIEKLNSVTIVANNPVDEKIREELYLYQYNSIKSLEYLQKYLNAGNIDDIKMARSYLNDLKHNNNNLKMLAEKYDF